MSIDTGVFSTDLIDVTGLSLEDLEALPDTSLTIALREVLTRDDTPTSAGFSSRLRRAE
ncbi:MAG TPA: FxSxx-COOH cyclophane-containing RiPP peptide [Trebonia sp.]|jgi:FXSXX-COOH protein|nr:FxSxx-COOH cyclophane-containing RiPP peptide [Trebonia sp.]